jgi:tRNA modification GTPase
VLSLPEVIIDTPTGKDLQIRIPQSLERLVTPETFLLLNKSDLEATPLASAVTVDCGIGGGGGTKAWVASLGTGEGTKEFLDNFARALQERYA